MTRTPATFGPRSHDRRPPADRRFLGLDTRVFPYAAAIAVVWLFWAVIVPAIDSAVPADDAVTTVGDRMAVTDAVSFAPTPGWTIKSGFRIGENAASGSYPRIVLTRGTVVFAVRADNFAGTADDLLDQIDAVDVATNGDSALAVTSERQRVSTSAGADGVRVAFDTPRSVGAVATFVLGGTGVEVQSVGPPDQVANYQREISLMTVSINGGTR